MECYLHRLYGTNNQLSVYTEQGGHMSKKRADADTYEQPNALSERIVTSPNARTAINQTHWTL